MKKHITLEDDYNRMKKLAKNILLNPTDAQLGAFLISLRMNVKQEP